jgi:hypothetical protein
MNNELGGTSVIYNLNNAKCADCTGLWRRHRHLRIRHVESKKYWKELRTAAMLRVGRGKLECEQCGIDRPEILEINHKDGGGGKEYHQFTKNGINIGGGRPWVYYNQIASGKRTINDLNLICKVCNAIHYVKFKYNIDWRPTIRVLE